MSALETHRPLSRFHDVSSSDPVAAKTPWSVAIVRAILGNVALAAGLAAMPVVIAFGYLVSH